MALENQPFFRAPSVPKLGRRNISSSIFSNASKLQPQLKTSTFSFLKPVQKEQQGTPITDTLKKVVSGEDSKDKQIYSALVETNRVLVEIQKQLSLDFASRITEKKQSLGSLRASMLKKRAAQKEKAIESINNDAGIIRGAFDKITAPAKGIFDRIIEFVSTIATGFVVNAAFGWLSDKKNRQKLLETFEFLTKHWKWLVGIFIGAKLVGAILKIVNLVRRLKGLVELIRRAWGKPPKPPSGGTSPKGGGPGPGPGTPDFCKGVYACIAGGIAQYVKLFTPYFQPISIPTTPPGGVRPPIPVAPIFQPGPTNPITAPTPSPPPTGTPLGPITLPNPLRLPDWANYTAYGALSSLAIPAGILAAPALGIGGGAGGGGAALTGGTAAGGLGLRALFSGAARTIPKTAPRGRTTLSRESMSRMLSKETESQLVKRIIDIYKKERGIQIKANNLEELADLLGVTVDSLVKGFSRRGAAGLPQILGSSQGGTVGGTGPGNVDSVPAMLAPGEEVIRTSSANLFRPLLKDINDNAGTMWLSFKDAIQEQEKNNARQASINSEFSSQINAFNKELEGLINQEKQKKIKDAEAKVPRPRVSNIPPEEGTGRGSPTDKPTTTPSLPTTPPSKEMGKSIPSGEGRNKVSPQTSPAPGPSPTPSSPSSSPTPGPTPTTGPQRIPVEPYNPASSQLSSIKPIQKSYAFNTLKPESGSKIAMLSYPMPPITLNQSSPRKNVSEFTPAPTAQTTNRLDSYISLAAMEYGILT